MFIDKFYRVYNPHTTQSRTAERASLTLNDKNKWNAFNRKIENVSAGTDLNDVSTVKQTLTHTDEGFKQGDKAYDFLQSEKNIWNAKKRKIANVEDGVELSDVPTVGQTLIYENGDFKRGKQSFKFMKLDGDSWNAEKHKLTNVIDGTNPNDVATVNQIPTNYMEINNDKWSGKDKQISNVKAGTNPNDVATVNQIPTNYMEITNDRWGGNHKQISYVKAGTNPNDVVTVNQLPTNYMEINNDKWSGKDKQISDVKAGVDANDCATIGQVLQHTNDVMKIDKNNWDAKGKHISNVALGIKPDDATVVRQVLIDTGSEGIMQGDKKYEFLQSRHCCWDAIDQKVINVAPGEGPNDVSTMSQVLIYDNKQKKFKCGNKYFDLVINNPAKPIVYFDKNRRDGRKILKEYETKLDIDMGDLVYYKRDDTNPVNSNLFTIHGSSLRWVPHEKRFKTGVLDPGETLNP